VTINFKGQVTNAWDARNQVAADILHKKRQVLSELLNVEWLLEDIKDYDQFLKISKTDEETINKVGLDIWL